MFCSKINTFSLINKEIHFLNKRLKIENFELIKMVTDNKLNNIFNN